ncbi:MAG: hydroxymethylbilane synthase [Raineya sp.]|jgi:hydroxymethylbilane synthase|nr:hydroxymethylbilane synthase [Raineya sp.]
MLKKLKIGTRSSKLALWQAYYVEEKLKNAGFQTEIVHIETKGDKILDRSLAKIGSKGVFTEELEEQLRTQDIHLAVHSAKDLPSEMPHDLEIIAFTERERVNDVLISFQQDISLKDNIIVGTSSTRRIATLKHFYPHIQTIEMRGNLQTRMQKLESGICDAIILAYAGVHRMNYDNYIVEHLSINTFTPAAGQGSVAIQVAENLDKETKSVIQNTLNHPETAYCLKAERSFLRTLQGGCSVPVFALATIQEGKISLNGGVISLDGTQFIQKEMTSALDDSIKLGDSLAQEILALGGKEVLEAIKR